MVFHKVMPGVGGIDQPCVDYSEAVVAPKEPEVQEMTLDEYKKTQRTARAAAQFNVRRAGEGEDPKQWKDGVVLPPRKRQETEETEEGEEVRKLTNPASFSEPGSGACNGHYVCCYFGTLISAPDLSLKPLNMVVQLCVTHSLAYTTVFYIYSRRFWIRGPP